IARRLEHGPKLKRWSLTSRNSLNLTGGAEVNLVFISNQDADKLIARLAPDLNSDQAALLRQISDGLPLMIEVAAQAINRSPRSADEVLADYESLAAEDYDERVRQRLAYSVDQLGEEDAAAWAALSHFEGGVFANYAAIMWGIEEDEAARWFERFHDRRLVIPMPELPYDVALGRRWRLHDHLRALAADRLEESALADEARDGWLTASEKMMATAGQMYDRHGEWIEVGLALLDADLPNIREAAEMAVALAPRNDAAARVVMNAPNHEVVNLRLTYGERLRWLEAGILSAGKRNQRALGAVLAGNAAFCLHQMGDLRGAEKLNREVLNFYEDSAGIAGMAAAYGNLGLILNDKGDWAGAAKMHRKALTLNAQENRKTAMAKNYGNLGLALFQQR
ncbi:MAG: tetratricopeptide repeat protein, partial [Pseudomonadota bacterium]